MALGLVDNTFSSESGRKFGVQVLGGLIWFVCLGEPAGLKPIEGYEGPALPAVYAASIFYKPVCLQNFTDATSLAKEDCKGFPSILQQGSFTHIRIYYGGKGNIPKNWPQNFSDQISARAPCNFTAKFSSLSLRKRLDRPAPCKQKPLYVQVWTQTKT